jgi:Flp pilus assembly protein TadG
MGAMAMKAARLRIWRNCRLRGFRKSERGVISVEFALVLPVLIILFIGLVEFTEAFTINRKLSNVASTVSDLVSQEASVTSASLSDVTQVANEIMKPYSPAPMSLVIVNVQANNDGEKTVLWSHPPGSYTDGETYTGLPVTETETGTVTELVDPNTSLIVVEAVYNFTPTISRFLGSFEISENAYFRPRMGQTMKID